MRNMKYCALVALILGLGLAPTALHAQTLSDLLQVSVYERNSTPPNPPYSNVILQGNIGIAEVSPETFEVTAPKIDIDFRENGSLPSDRLHIDQFTFNFVSDDPATEAPLPRRPGAVLIPASALEAFLPYSIFADSDGDQQTTQNSDSVTIYQGFYGQPAPVPVFSATIPPVPEGTPEPPIFWTLPPISFDIEEEYSTGGQFISDYVDMPQLTGFFLSSDNPADYQSLPPADTFIVEDPLTGNGVHYSLGVASDIPEPGFLAFAGLLGAGLLIRRKQGLKVS